MAVRQRQDSHQAGESFESPRQEAPAQEGRSSDTLVWLYKNHLAEFGEFEAKLKEPEGVVQARRHQPYSSPCEGT